MRTSIRARTTLHRSPPRAPRDRMSHRHAQPRVELGPTRVLLAYLTTAGLVEHIAAVATRGRVKRVWVSGDGNVTVNVGPPRILADRPVVTAALRRYSLNVGTPLGPRAQLVAEPIRRPPFQDRSSQ